MPKLKIFATCFTLIYSTTLIAWSMAQEGCDEENHTGPTLAKYDHNGDNCINVLDLDIMGYYYVPNGIVSTFPQEAWRFDLDGDGIFTRDDIADQVANTKDNAYELPEDADGSDGSDGFENLVFTFGDANGSLKVSFVATPTNVIPDGAYGLISDVDLVKRNYQREINREHKWTSGDFDFDGFVSPRNLAWRCEC